METDDMGQPLVKQHHSIWTPELVELSLPLAGITRRVLARLIDQIILTAVYLAIFIGGLMATGATHSVFNRHFGHSGDIASMVVICLAFILFVLADFLYYWAFHAMTGGRTPGKMALGIRVVTLRGGRINGVTSLIRALFNFIDTLLFWGSIAAMMILATDQERRIADFAAGTLVVNDR